MKTGRILQLICVQTKPVQIYRITARDALPPTGTLLRDDVCVDGGGLAAAGSPVSVATAASGVGEDEMMASDHAAVTKERGGGVDGRISALKFEKVREDRGAGRL